MQMTQLPYYKSTIANVGCRSGTHVGGKKGKWPPTNSMREVNNVKEKKF